MRNDFVAWCEREITVARERLEQCESGRMFIGLRNDAARWEEVTDLEARRLRETIAELNAFIADSEKKAV